MAAALAAGLTLSFSPAVEAAATLDANVSQTAFNSVLALRTMAQTFTVLHPGTLTQVDLYSGTFFSPVPLSIQVWSVDNGNPVAVASSVAVSGTLPFSLNWHAFPLKTTVPVTAGQQFAIVAAAGLANYFRWGYNGAAGYKGGKMLVLSGSSWLPFSSLPAGAAFNFRTWVDPTAQGPTPPTISHGSSTASAPEGTAPTMTGVFSNPNGGSVSLKPDHGTVTPQTGTGGTWTWTGDMWDEDTAPTSTTVTATDPATGLSATTTFPVSVTGVKPTLTIVTDPVSSPEGSPVGFSGSASSPDPTDQKAGFALTWKVTKDGSDFASGSGPNFTFTTTDEGSYLVTLAATDDGGMTNTTTLAVQGTEITPTAAITSIRLADPTVTFIAPQATLNFNGTFTDPAPEAHTFDWDFGDGASATSLATSHAYAVAGTYTVTLTVKDDEGVAGTATATVKVLTPQQALASMIAWVQGLTSLNKGQQQSLIAKLNAAADSSARGDNKAANNQLNAFINELEADLSSGKISAVAYNALRADAHAVQGALGTFNRFLEWWPLPA